MFQAINLKALTLLQLLIGYMNNAFKMRLVLDAYYASSGSWPADGFVCLNLSH